MSTLPANSELLDSAVTQAQFKAKLGQTLDFQRGLLGSDGTAATARAALGLADVPLVYPDMGAWATGESYNAEVLSLQGGIVYRSLMAHVAGVFATDYAAGKWIIHQGATKEQAQAVGAAAGAAAAAAEVVIATEQAVISTTQAGISTTQAGLSATAKTASEAARDAALIQAGVYATEALGRAAVADGMCFKVQGAGSIAAYEYRRTNSTTSVLVSTYPSIAAYTALIEKQKLKADLIVGKNLFNPNDTDFVTGYFVDQTNGNLTANASYASSGFIPVVEGVSYAKSWSNGSAGTWQFAWFNQNKVYISGSSVAVATAPVGATYLRASIPTTALSTYQVEVGSASTRYIPYTPTLPINQLSDGAVTELKHASSSVNYRHTNFLQPVKNLFNIVDPNVVLGSYVNGGDGTLIVNAAYNTTGYIPVAGGASYRLSYGNQIAWYDASKNYISGVTGIGGGATTQVAPSNAVYLRAMVLLAQWALFQVEAGASSTAWTPFQLKLIAPGGADALATPADSSTTPAKTTFLPVGKNKFNVFAGDISLGNYVLFSSGLLAAHASYNTTGYIPVVSGVIYTLSFKHQIAWYDSNKAYISGSNSTDANPTQTAPAGAAFLRCSVLLTYWTYFQVEEGSLATTFESYGYVLRDPVYPIRLPITDTDFLAVSAKQYVPYGKEIAIYHENIVRDYPTYKGRTSIAFAGGKEVGSSTKLIPLIGQSGATISAVATVADSSFSPVSTKNFSVIVTDSARTVAANIQNIGDSYTGRMTWANVINASMGATGLTFSGNRTSGAASPNIQCEGQGGWLLSSYFTVDYMGFLSPFMQPVTAGYLYYGNTTFWIDANSVTPSYNAANFTTVKGLFSPTTGRKLAPNTGDIMGDAGGYIQWNGSAWVAIVSGTFGGFAFSYAKYRIAWTIPAPTILHILLGANDFTGATETSFISSYPAYKTNYDALIASVKADTPAVKIVVGIPVSSGRQGKNGTLTSEKQKRAYYLLANKLNTDYGGREAENIYVLDYHSVVDRFYGFDNVYEKPFTDYTGATGDDIYKSDTVHLGADGFKQMGNAYMGLIQFLR